MSSGEKRPRVSSFDYVEKVIGRRLEDCVQTNEGKNTIKHFFDLEDKEVHVWTPNLDMYLEVVQTVINHYSSPQDFAPPEHEVWPYIDIYNSLDLALFLDKESGNKLEKIDSIYKEELRLESRSGYDHAKRALVFCDGVQILDPFFSLYRVDGFSRSWGDFLTQTDIEDLDGVFLPPTEFFGCSEHLLAEREGTQLQEFQIVWAACLQEALNLKPLVDADMIRLTPGAFVSYGTMLKLNSKIKSLHDTFDVILDSSDEFRGLDKWIKVHNDLRAAQNIFDASPFTPSTPFFFTPRQLRAGQKLISSGVTKLDGVSASGLNTANLSTQLGVKTEELSDSDLISVRKNDDTLMHWKTLRSELSAACTQVETEAEMAQETARITALWKERLELELRRESALSKKFVREGVLYGVTGTSVGGGLALAGGAGLPLIALAALGGLATGSAALYNLSVAKKENARAEEARTSLRKHLMSFDNRSNSRF